jgi:hypothetical protein
MGSGVVGGSTGDGAFSALKRTTSVGDIPLISTSGGAGSAAAAVAASTGRERLRLVPLLDCVRAFMAEERLEGADAYHCERCKVQGVGLTVRGLLRVH